MKTGHPDQAEIQKADRVLRLIWVVAGGAILFSMLTVTPLVQRVSPQGWEWTAPLLPLVVDAAVIIVVRMDGAISRLGAKPGGWAGFLRWITGLFTLALNIGDSALDGNLVGVGIHAVAPVLLIATSEAIPHYRRSIAGALERIAREQDAERARREQQREAREQRERQEREQSQARRERLENDERERLERSAREQREHEQRMAREDREYRATLEREKEERAEASRQADLDRQERIRLAEIAAKERGEQAQREQDRLREQAAHASREQARAAREQSKTETREHPAAAPAAPREHRALHAVNTPVEKPVNTQKIAETEAVNMIREAVNSGQVSVRGLARATGWSTGWVSGQVSELRETDAEEVPA